MVVIHSDRGASLTSEHLYQYCRELSLDQATGRIGVLGTPFAWNAAHGGWDNVMIEFQWSVLKSEFDNRCEWDTPVQAIQAVRA